MYYYLVPAESNGAGILLVLPLLACFCLDWNIIGPIIVLALFSLSLIFDFAAVARMEFSHIAKRAVVILPLFILSKVFYALGITIGGGITLGAFIFFSIILSCFSVSPLYEDERKEYSDSFLPLEMILVVGVFIAAYFIFTECFYFDENTVLLVEFLFFQIVVIVLNIVLEHSFSACLALEISLFIGIMVCILFYPAITEGVSEIFSKSFFSYVNERFCFTDMFDSFYYDKDSFYFLDTYIQIPCKYIRLTRLLTIVSFTMLTVVPIIIISIQNTGLILRIHPIFVISVTISAIFLVLFILYGDEIKQWIVENGHEIKQYIVEPKFLFQFFQKTR